MTQVPERQAETPTGGVAVAARLRGVVMSREFSVVVVIAAVCLVMPFTSARDSFYTDRNVLNIARQVSLLAIFAVGETVVVRPGASRIR